MLHFNIKMAKLLAIYCLLILASIGVTYALTWDNLTREVEYSLMIGDWLTEVWQEETFYSEGDIVYFEGNYYIAIKKNVPKNIEPIGHPASWVFWEPNN